MILKELERFGFHNCTEENIISQADKEKSRRQIWKAIQQVRAQVGLETDAKTSAVKPHASNGLAERGIQNVTRLGNCLMQLCEERTRIQILGTSEVRPWRHRHAVWSTFRVPKPGTKSYELMHDRIFKGSACLFGVSVPPSKVTFTSSVAFAWKIPLG